MPTRGLLGFRQAFLTATRGTGIIHSLFYGYEPYAGTIKSRQTGSLVAWETGAEHDLRPVQRAGARPAVHQPRRRGLRGDDRRPPADRRGPGAERDQEEAPDQPPLFGGDELVHLETPINMSLDDCLEYIADDELVEVTPKSIRLRKRILDTEDRKKDRKARSLAAEAAA